MMPKLKSRDSIAGLAFMAFGAAYLYYDLKSLPLGSAVQMGPGYFPLIVGILLVLLGLAIFLRSLVSAGEAISAIAVRGPLLISLSVAVFALFVRELGFVPVVMLSCLIACFASSRMTFRFALALAAALTGFSYSVFIVGLDLPIPAFGSWIR